MATPARFQIRRKTVRLAAPIVAVAALGLVACSNSQEPSDQPGTTPPVWTGAAEPGGAGAEGHGSGGEGGGGQTLSADLQDASGSSVGTVTFAEEGEHVVVEVEATGLTPGFHGLHVHQMGRCEPNSTAPTGGAPGNFLSAGGHLHAQGNTGHPANGDLSSLQVRQDGSAALTTTTDLFTLDDLTAEGGRAVIVHANADNFANIPTRYAPAPDQETLNTGDAGGRVACGVIQ